MEEQCKHDFQFIETEQRGEAKVDTFWCPICEEFKEIIRYPDGQRVELDGWD